MLMATIRRSLWNFAQQATDAGRPTAPASGQAESPSRCCSSLAMGGLAARCCNWSRVDAWTLLGLQPHAFAIGSGPITAALLARHCCAVLRRFRPRQRCHARCRPGDGRAGARGACSCSPCRQRWRAASSTPKPAEVLGTCGTILTIAAAASLSYLQPAAAGDGTRRSTRWCAALQRRPAADHDAPRRAVRDSGELNLQSSPASPAVAGLWFWSSSAPSAAPRRGSRPIWRRPSPPTLR